VRLATLDDGTRDGRLVVVSRGGDRCAPAGAIAPTMQAAMDRWDDAALALRALAARLDDGSEPGEAFDPARCAAPLPRAPEWVDGSAYINHIVLVRKARGAEPPRTLRTDPLVYQGGSSDLLGPRAPMELPDPAWGLDFEAEIGVILGDVPRGTTAAEAHRFVRLLVLLNDWSYRGLIPGELEKGFGFFQSKPATAFSPLAITPDELGGAWRDGRVHLPLVTHLNGQKVGDPDAGPEMFFSFFDLVAHIAKTRRFQAGTILGSGTVSNEDRSRGISCLAERRMIETIDDGKPSTPFLSVGDVVTIEMRDAAGRDLFGRIEGAVVKAEDRGRWRAFAPAGGRA
jgi:fumarylacetoacetate (FAA) hydrolase